MLTTAIEVGDSRSVHQWNANPILEYSHEFVYVNVLHGLFDIDNQYVPAILVN